MGIWKTVFGTDMTATISDNQVRVQGPRGSGSATAPFSCSHLLVSDVDVLEEAIRSALKDLGTSFFMTFPVMTVSVQGRAIHPVEEKAIRDSFINAGAIGVSVTDIPHCRENESRRSAYVAELMRHR